MSLKLVAAGDCDPHFFDIPTDTPCVVLTGTRQDVREAAALFRQDVVVVEAGELARLTAVCSAARTFFVAQQAVFEAGNCTAADAPAPELDAPFAAVIFAIADWQRQGRQ